MSSTATITVTAKTWTETPVEGLPGVVRAEFTSDYAGDAQGSSTCWLLIAYTGGDPADRRSLVGEYTGYELFTGTLAGREGSCVLAASGVADGRRRHRAAGGPRIGHQRARRHQWLRQVCRGRHGVHLDAGVRPRRRRVDRT